MKTQPPKGLVAEEHFKRFYNAAEGGDALEIYVYGRIGASWWDDGVSAASIAAILKAYPDCPLINLRINSLGGSVFEGSAIYNQLARHPAKKVVDIDGVAASAASWIAMVGDERRMGLNGFFMIHEASGDTWGPADEHDKTSVLLRKMNEQQIDIYERVSKLTRAELRAAVKAETWYTAQEALKAGFLTSTAASELKTTAKAELPDMFEAYGFKRAPEEVGKFFSFGNTALRFGDPTQGDGFAAAWDAASAGLEHANPPTQTLANANDIVLTPRAATALEGVSNQPLVSEPPVATPPAPSPPAPIEVPQQIGRIAMKFSAAMFALLGISADADEATIEAAVTAKCQQPMSASEAVMTALGTRSEQAALERVRSLQNVSASLLASTGSSTGEEALGTIAGWKHNSDQNAKLVRQLSEAQMAIQDAKRDGLIAKLSSEGKLPPAAHDWARTQTAEQLEVWAAGFAKGLFTTAVTEQSGSDKVELTDVDRQAAKAMGISPAAFLEGKKRDIAARKAAAV